MTKNSQEITDLKRKFQTYYPGGHSNLKVCPGSMRTIVSSANGSRFWGMDGTEYIDYACAFGPNILGHRHPQYIESLRQSMESTAMCIGGMFAFSENDVTAAEKIIQHVPCAERVKLTTSGTEAVQTAIRIARSYTGRPYVLRFEGHYHGWIDSIWGFDSVSKSEGKPYAVANKEFSGRGPGSEEGVLMIEWNNIEVMEETLKSCGEEIAIIIMEPYAANSDGRFPRPGYLERVRELCDHYGIVLCFDEIQTGFRMGLTGAQGAYGVTPDMTTLGKALGGGMPISAVVGKAQVMDVLKNGNTLCAGTYMGHFLCVQGLIATLEILERDGGAVYMEMERVQKRLMSGLDEIARRRNIPVRVQGVTGLFVMLFGVDPDKLQYSNSDAGGLDQNMGLKYWQLIQDHGIMLAQNRWMLSIMHTDQDTDIALEAADKAMARM